MPAGRHVPDARVTGIVAGLHVVIELPKGQRKDDVVARARRHGLVMEGLDTYSAAAPGHGPGHKPALVVGYATPPEHAFGGAIATLCAVLEGVEPSAGG